MLPKPLLGVCYYPEHWPEEKWADDAANMKALGLSVVRIGEFAWSRMEPEANKFDWQWLDKAIEILAAAGLKIILGTPTATPPKWLVDTMPDMLAVDREGRTRGFGSRRHYCFSHKGYRAQCARIVTELAKRYGRNDAIIGFQTDNEYACHDTVYSWSDAARDGFREWLQQKYQSPWALNRCWGNVFWSMEYAGFEEIDLPGRTVTEANPAHWMDYCRFASDEVVAFNRIQTSILRKLAPGKDVIHNFMGRTVEFDHFDVGSDLNVSSWDSYPLGFLDDRSDRPDEFRRDHARQGDPDFQAFHHDLYRATSAGRWWVMEQQPGPVNWASHNPAPLPGMIRLWTHEAVAHGAEVVSYFRWRQVPFAQEQMHAGLRLPDDREAVAYEEVSVTAAELEAIGSYPASQAEVAIVFDYASAWAWKIQPQGKEFDYFRIVFDFYRGFRRLGVSVDILPASVSDLAPYKLVVVPALFCFPESLRKAMENYSGHLLIGPRSGSKTPDFSIPANLAPDLPGLFPGFKVERVETLRADNLVTVANIGEAQGTVQFWREMVSPGACDVEVASDDGWPVLITQARAAYLCGWPDEMLMKHLLRQRLLLSLVDVLDVPQGLSLRRSGNRIFAGNYGLEAIDLSILGIDGEYLVGSKTLATGEIAILEV